MNAETAQLAARARELGLTEIDLDEEVYELCAAAGSVAANHLSAGDEDMIECIIEDAEADASDVNNGGLDEQIDFLLERLGAEDTARLVERLGAAKARS